MPHGTFVVLQRLPNLQVALFQHRTTVACTDTNSPTHNKLPRPITIRPTRPLSQMISFLPPVSETASHIQVGAVIIYGVNYQYKVTPEEKVIINDSSEMVVVEYGNENQRTDAAVAMLKQVFGTSLQVERTSRDTEQHCPFSGGGDIYIYHKMNAIAIMTGVEEDWEKEIKCGATEEKVTSQQKNQSLCLQLQANMMVLSSKMIQKRIKSHPASCEKLNSITCYGLLIGPVHPLVYF